MFEKLILPDISKCSSWKIFSKSLACWCSTGFSAELSLKPHPHNPKAHHAQKFRWGHIKSQQVWGLFIGWTTLLSWSKNIHPQTIGEPSAEMPTVATSLLLYGTENVHCVSTGKWEKDQDKTSQTLPWTPLATIMTMIAQTELLLPMAFGMGSSSKIPTDS